MTTMSLGEDHFTAHDLLFGSLGSQQTAEVLAVAMAASDGAGQPPDAIAHLPSATRVAARHEVGVAADTLLDLDLGEAVVAGWLKYEKLLEAGRRTRGSSVREVVELVTHRITATYTPHVDLYVDDIRMRTVELRLELAFDITGVSAVIAAGDLVAIQGGDVDITGTLTAAGATVVTRSRKLPSHLVVTLRRPVPLIRPADATSH
jgi:hypothetical protein